MKMSIPMKIIQIKCKKSKLDKKNNFKPSNLPPKLKCGPVQPLKVKNNNFVYMCMNRCERGQTNDHVTVSQTALRSTFPVPVMVLNTA